MLAEERSPSPSLWRLPRGDFERGKVIIFEGLKTWAFKKTKPLAFTNTKAFSKQKVGRRNPRKLYSGTQETSGWCLGASA